MFLMFSFLFSNFCFFVGRAAGLTALKAVLPSFWVFCPGSKCFCFRFGVFVWAQGGFVFNTVFLSGQRFVRGSRWYYYILSILKILNKPAPDSPSQAASPKQSQTVPHSPNQPVPIRPDIAFVVKELARDLHAPASHSWTRLRHVGRYLQGTKDYFLIMKPKLQISARKTPLELETYVASDWAGCHKTRKSTMGVPCI